KSFDDVVEFHGHLCPGLAIGFRVARAALDELGQRAEDEELVAVVENDS
ncbi:formylmethanofuran dehydrogenase, partial [Candidatus Saccharibacteria bacterium]|nr:formylmethanofuran dehydrogenase [Candidatus Saccharibacteria bacterium]